jgi:hypothetical protein
VLFKPLWCTIIPLFDASSSMALQASNSHIWCAISYLATFVCIIGRKILECFYYLVTLSESGAGNLFQLKKLSKSYLSSFSFCTVWFQPLFPPRWKLEAAFHCQNYEKKISAPPLLSFMKITWRGHQWGIISFWG